MSDRNLPPNAKFAGKLDGRPVVYKTTEGALCLAILAQLVSAPVAWSGKYTATLVSKDGERRERTIEDMMKIFAWDGVNPFDIEDMEQEALDAVEFDVVGESEQYKSTTTGEMVWGWKIKWLNPTGSSGVKMPDKVEDRDALLAEFGGIFRAMNGGKKPAGKPAARRSAPEPEPEATEDETPAEEEEEAPPAKSAPSRGAAPAKPKIGSKTTATARTATKDEVWDALVAKYPKKKEAEVGKMFFAAQDEVDADAAADDTLTPAQWGKVADKLSV